MNRLRCGSKPKSACRGAPEARVLLRVAVVVGADQSVEIGRQFDPFQLQRQRVAVRVGDQRHALAGPAQGGEEGIGVRTQRDQVRHLVLEFADRQVQFPAPEIQAAPVELAGVFAEQAARARRRLRCDSGRCVRRRAGAGVPARSGCRSAGRAGCRPCRAARCRWPGPGQGWAWRLLSRFVAIDAEICRFPSISDRDNRKSRGYDNPPASPRSYPHASETHRTPPARSSRRADCSLSRSCNCASAMASSAPTSVWSARARATVCGDGGGHARCRARGAGGGNIAPGSTNTSCRCPRAWSSRARTSSRRPTASSRRKRATVPGNWSTSPNCRCRRAT